MTATLVLNASYEPLAVVPFQRAVVLVLTERAELVEANGTVASPSTEVPRPAVIRLVRYVKLPRHRRARTLAVSRTNVLRRDRHTCAYCHGPADTIDHVVPRSRGGTTTWANCVAACRPCNGRKGDRLLSELGWTLGFTPKPLVATERIVVAIRATEPAWQPYLATAR